MSGKLLIRYKITSYSADRAFVKLARAGICARNAVKTNKNTLLVSVNIKDSKKIFAIFDNACYNIERVGEVGFFAPAYKLVKRPIALIGTLMVLALCLLTRGLVFDVEVYGSGAYYDYEVKQILLDEGIKPFSFYGGGSRVANARILALKGVSFCKVEKVGYSVRVQVITDEEPEQALRLGNLTSDRAGVVEDVTLLRGRSCVSVGDKVEQGQILVEASDAAVASVSLRCAYEYSCRGEAGLQSAYGEGALLLEGETVISKSHTERLEGDKLFYDVKYEYLHICSINM